PVGLSLAFMLHFPKGTRQGVGLTARRLGRHVLGGLLFAAVFAPGAYGLQALVLQLVGMLGGKAENHPFTQLGQQQLYPVEWVLLISSAVATAPVSAGLLYPGLIQPGAIARRPWGGLGARVSVLV